MRLLLLAVFLFVGGAALADPIKARESFAAAEKSYQSGELNLAIDAYAAAYREEQDPAYLFNLAQCYRKLGDSAASITLFTRYLREAPGASNRASVEEAILYLQSTPSTVVLGLPDLNPTPLTLAPTPPEKGKKAFLVTIAGAAILLSGGGVLAFFFAGPGVPNTALGHQDGFRD